MKTVDIHVGQTYQLTATLVSLNGERLNITTSASWVSNDQAIATVSSGGLVTAMASSGTTTITSTLGSGSVALGFIKINDIP